MYLHTEVVLTPSNGHLLCKSPACIAEPIRPDFNVSKSQNRNMKYCGESTIILGWREIFYLVCTKNAFRIHQIYRTGASKMDVSTRLRLTSRFTQMEAYTGMKRRTSQMGRKSIGFETSTHHSYTTRPQIG